MLRSLALATKMLEDLCLSLPKIFIVVDGLDECGQTERKQILDVLTGLVSQCDVLEAGRLRLVVVSQDFVDIKRALFGSGNTKLGPKVVQISHDDNENDICTYVKSWVGKIAVKYDLPKGVTEHLTNLTVANARGCIAP